MRTARALCHWILDRIGHIYLRPLMYGGTAQGVDLILHYYHELWAVAMDRGDEYEAVRCRAYKRQKCGSATFATRYQIMNPQHTDVDATAYVVAQWRRISTDLGMEIPRHHLEFPQHKAKEKSSSGRARTVRR